MNTGTVTAVVITQKKSTARKRLAGGLVAAAIGVIMSAAAHSVEIGQPAPDFTLPGSDGQSYTLSDLRGQHVVIAFFPKAFTGG